MTAVSTAARFPTRRLHVRLPGLVAYLLLIACGTIPRKQTRQSGVILMAPLVFETGTTDAPVQIWDPYSAFDNAVRADCNAAVGNYSRIGDQDSDADLRDRARYNLANCLMQLGQPDQAIDLFYKILDSSGTDVIRRNSYTRLGNLLEAAKQWEPLEQLLARFEKEYRLNNWEKAEILVRKAATRLARNDRRQAFHWLKRALKRFPSPDLAMDDTLPKPIPERVRYYKAWAHIYFARLLRWNYAEVRLAYPDRVLRRRLDQKAELLLRVQTNYLVAVKQRIGEPMVTAIHELGQLYLDFYHTLHAVAIPSDLEDDAESERLYRDLLDEETHMLLSKTADLLQRAIAVAEVAQVSGASVEAARHDLKMVEEIARQIAFRKRDNEGGSN